MPLPLSLLLRSGAHRLGAVRRWQPALSPLLSGCRRAVLLADPAAQLPLLRRGVLLVRSLVRRRAPLWFPPPFAPAGTVSNWRRFRRRPLPAALLLLSPSLLPLGREGSRLGLPVLAPSPVGWISHPLPPMPPRPLLRLLVRTALRRRRSEVAQW